MTLPDIPRNEGAFPRKNPNRFLPRGVPPVHTRLVEEAPERAATRGIDEYLAEFYGQDYAKSVLPVERPGYTQGYVEPEYEGEAQRTDRVFPWPMWVWAGLSIVAAGLVFFLLLR